MDVYECAKAAEPYIIERRRYYHAHPELTGMEIGTTKAIVSDLRAMGIESRLFKKGTGLTAEIHGPHPGKTLILRADIDALNVREKTGLPFASKNGYMHACGHDCHIAMQLGAAKILSEIRDEFPGTVRLLFQPAEEGGNGALMCIEEGALEGADAIYGTHVWGTVRAPLIDVTSGFRMAASNRFKLRIHGVTAHGSAPHLGADAITAACSIVMNLQMLVSRFNCPSDPMVLTIGKMNGGTQYNCIPDRVEIEGTIRHFRTDQSIEKEMRRMIGGIADAMKVTWDLDYIYLNCPVENRYDEITRICQNSAAKLFGEDVFAHMPTLMSSEDFSWYLREMPGVFTYIGSSNPEKGITGTNHQSTYDVDEDVLKRGTALAVQFALDFLNS
ncbi:MAG: amidohydrolase [Flexilinea sp.]|nr:amidohydrolase [Flexilinea sp.]